MIKQRIWHESIPQAARTLLSQGVLVAALVAGVLSGVYTVAGSASSNVTAGLTGLPTSGAAPCSGVSRNSFCTGHKERLTHCRKLQQLIKACRARQGVPQRPVPLLAVTGLSLHLHVHLQYREKRFISTDMTASHTAWY